MDGPSTTLIAAASMLDVSEATVRRYLANGTLSRWKDGRPVSVDTSSLLAAREDKLKRMGLMSSDFGNSNVSRILELEMQVETLVEVIRNLRMSEQLMLDSIGTLTPMRIPKG